MASSADMTHTPKPPEEYALWPVLMGGAIMAGILAAVILMVVTYTTPPEVSVVADIPDRAAFCEGWPSGLAVSVSAAGVPASDAIAWASGPEAPPCEPDWATYSDYESAWCEGFARAYIHAGVYLIGTGEPPMGRNAWVHDEFVPECLVREAWLTPPVPGGGGPPPSDS